jgi:hypothetical protein
MLDSKWCYFWWEVSHSDMVCGDKSQELLSGPHVGWPATSCCASGDKWLGFSRTTPSVEGRFKLRLVTAGVQVSYRRGAG